MVARQIAIGFGIAVIFPLLLYYGVSTYQPAPKYAVFFATAAEAQRPPANPDEQRALAEKRQIEQKAYEAAAKTFAAALFRVATPLGILAILLGSYLPFPAVGSGLVFGGIFAAAEGYWFYWLFLEDWMRFVSLAVTFAALVFVGVRKVPTARGG
jgi:hypothetical protein